jgi:hypothetical protein
MKHSGRVRFTAVVSAAAVLAVAVSCRTPSEEARIRGTLKEAVADAEKKDVDALRTLFHPDYADFEGRDTEGTLRLVTDHLDRYSGIVIHLLGARLEALEPDGRASVTCEVSLSHGAAEVLRKLIRYVGEYYRFRIDLRKTGSREWRFVYAEWRSIGLPELFPESLDILKKLFPGL